MNKLQQMRRSLPSWARDGILAGYRGSHAHGLYVPPTEPFSTDDVDVFQVTVQPPRFYLGLDSWGRKRQVHETAGQHLDIVVYDVRKFVALLRKGNPNVHVWLWSEPEDYFVRTPAAEHLITNRHRFLTQRVLDSFAGYAANQIRRMTHHVKEGYMGEKRSALVKEFGYDTKNAGHCLRLLHMGIETARENRIRVKRVHDRDLLLAVKRGEWSLDKVKDYADNLWREFNDARKDNGLRPDMPVEEADSILIRCMKRHWEDKNMAV